MKRTHTPATMRPMLDTGFGHIRRKMPHWEQWPQPCYARHEASDFAPGDRVAYTAEWLQNVGMQATYLATKQGVVVETGRFILVQWPDDAEPTWVSGANLCFVRNDARFKG